MRMPFDGSFTMTCSYACHKASSNETVRNYAGVDWGMPIGTPLTATEAGIVTTGTGTYGELFANLKSLDGRRVSQYVHLSRFGHVGEVTEGMHVGFSGNTGITTGPHLHFATIVDGVRVDPMTLLSMSPAGPVRVGVYVMYRKDTNIRTGNGVSYPVQTVAKTGSVWYVKGGPRIADGYEWWDMQVCDQNNGELGSGSGWSALRLTGADYWVAVVEKPEPIDLLYRVLDNASEVGSYLIKDNAFDKWYTKQSQTVTYQGSDITSEFITMANVLEQKIVELEAQIVTLTADVETLQSLANKLQAENVALKSQLAVLEAENADLKKQVTMLGQANKKLKEQVDTLIDLNKNFLSSVWGKLYLIFNKP